MTSRRVPGWVGLLLVVAVAGIAPREPALTTTATLRPTVRRSVGGVSALDRMQYFGGEWGPEHWSPEHYAQFGANGFRVHPGRGTMFQQGMKHSLPDPRRPGFVNKSSLLAHCAAYPHRMGVWPLADVDMIHIDGPEQMYPNSCQGEGGPRPSGFVPGTAAATAEFFALYYQHCMYPTAQNRYLIEVMNECNVKHARCNTTWQEMIQQHIAVADALHATHKAQPSLPRPVVCGPTAAFPEYQGKNFQAWRPGGMFHDFVAQAGPSIDAFSVHFYDTFHPPKPDPDSDLFPDPFTTNFSVHSGSNLLAELDLQESATIVLNPSSAGKPLPLLVSEYGGGVPASTYSPGHNWWIIRSTVVKMMAFMERPDRILKALPFITGLDDWSKTTQADNSSHSYPYVLWRAVIDQTNKTVWAPTHLWKMYAALAEIDGDRFVVRSSHAAVQVLGFAHASERSNGKSEVMWHVVFNNVDMGMESNKTVKLVWPIAGGADVRSVQNTRLFWSGPRKGGAPAVEKRDLPPGVLPQQVGLGPGELSILTVTIASAGLPATTAVDERTYYSDRILQPMASSRATARPYEFQNDFHTGGSDAVGEAPTVQLLKIRVSFGGGSTSEADAQSRFAAVAAGMHITVGTQPCEIDPARQIAGQLHIGNDFSFLSAIEVDVPDAVLFWYARQSLMVTVWSDAAQNDSVVSSVVVVGETPVLVALGTSSDLQSSPRTLKNDDETIRNSEAPVLQLLQTLHRCMQEIPVGQDSMREQASAAVAALFLNVSSVDRQSRHFLAASLASFRGNGTLTQDDLSKAATVPQLELAGVAELLRSAVSECKCVCNGTLKRPTALSPRVGQLRLNHATGFLHDEQDVPRMLYGYSQAPPLDKSTVALSQPLAQTFADVYFTPSRVLDSEQCCGTNAKAIAEIVQQLDGAYEAGGYANIFLGNGNANGDKVQHAFPAWAEALFPNISTGAGKTHFYSYDIDHPGTRKLLGIVVRAVVAAVAGHPGSLGWSLANEPGFSSSNSEYTFRNFSRFLSGRYSGNVSALAEAWVVPGGLSSFQDRVIFQGMSNSGAGGKRMFSTRQLLDWEAFNNQRVTAFYAWLCGEINGNYHKAQSPPVSCFAKTSNSASGVHPATKAFGPTANQPHGDAGIDRAALLKTFTIQACDTRMLPTSEPHYSVAKLPSNLYAIDWLGTAASYDFMRANQSQLLMESEWHSVSTVNYRQDPATISSKHIRAGLWIGHVHGMTVNTIWVWGRDGWSGQPKGVDGFWGSLALQPQAFDAFARGSVEINAISVHMEAWASQTPQIYVFYSAESLGFDRESLEDSLACYSLLHSLGVPVGWSTTIAPGKPMVIAGAKYVSSTVAHELQWAVTQSSPLFMVANPATAFQLTEQGLPSDADVVHWATTIPRLNMPMADAATFHELDAILSRYIYRPVRCTDGSGHRMANAAGTPTLFGVMCRHAPSTRSLVVLNLLNTTVTLNVEVGHAQLPKASEILTGRIVSFPLQLPPLEPMVFTVGPNNLQ